MTPAHRHKARVAALACACCRKPGPSSVHHIRHEQGMGQRAGHGLVIPLCWDCHQGPHGIHGDRSVWRLRKLSELDALNWTVLELDGTP